MLHAALLYVCTHNTTYKTSGLQVRVGGALTDWPLVIGTDDYAKDKNVAAAFTRYLLPHFAARAAGGEHLLLPTVMAHCSGLDGAIVTYRRGADVPVQEWSLQVGRERYRLEDLVLTHPLTANAAAARGVALDTLRPRVFQDRFHVKQRLTKAPDACVHPRCCTRSCSVFEGLPHNPCFKVQAAFNIHAHQLSTSLGRDDFVRSRLCGHIAGSCRFHSQFGDYKSRVSKALARVDPSKVGNSGQQAVGSDGELVRFAAEELDKEFAAIEKDFCGERDDSGLAPHEEIALRVLRVTEGAAVVSSRLGSAAASPEPPCSADDAAASTQLLCPPPRVAARVAEAPDVADSGPASTCGAGAAPASAPAAPSLKRVLPPSLPDSAATKRLKKGHANQQYKLLSAGAQVCFLT